MPPPPVVGSIQAHSPHASPKGLRLSFRVAAVSAGIPLNLVQKWQGHAQLTTTAIYAKAVGKENRLLPSVCGNRANVKPEFRGPIVDHTDKHLQEREAEKTADLESLADALAAFRQLHRELDQWERVHLALGLAAVMSGCYGIGELEAALALTPEVERVPNAKLPNDPVYDRFDLALFERALDEAWAEPARRFPHFGRIELP